MRKILLTGAGFSRMWGGWLASEAFEFLLGIDGLHPNTRRILWRAKEDGTGFEGVYSALRDRSNSQEGFAIFDQFDTAVRDMFFVMNSRYEKFRFHDNIMRFLAGFDAIFTLNQDTLKEARYVWMEPNLIRKMSQGRFLGCETPGLRGPLQDSFMPEGYLTPMEPPYSLRDRLQPYFKLHGSSNWVQAQSTHLMLVLGAGKETEIARYPLLTWYHQEFERLIAESQLMIVGYSFSDPHINAKIASAAKTGTRFFIVDPLGADVLDKRDKRAQIPQPHDAVFETIMQNVDGASRRDLVDTLTAGTIERTKLDHFLTRDERKPPPPW